jgi:surface antigen
LVRCAGSARRAELANGRRIRIRVRRRGQARHGSRDLITPGSLRVRLSTAQPGRDFSGRPGSQADEGGRGGGCGPEGIDGGGYCNGYCTHYVWTRRPDLSRLGDATNWLSGAQVRGIPTGTKPVKGAAAWWPHPLYPGDRWGHIAYVESTTASTVTVREMNWDGPNVVTTRTIGLDDARAPHAYIYGGPAGNGPGAIPGGSGPVGSGWEVAFQGSNGSLWVTGADVRGDLGLGMAPGTSPSITGLTTGGWEVAFQGSNGNLWVTGADVRGDLGLGMAPGTSPSITGLSSGGWQVTFRASNGTLWTTGRDVRGDLGLGVASGTSPSIAGLADGNWQVAWNAGSLWTTGRDVRGDLGLGMAPGTSPSITSVR